MSKVAQLWLSYKYDMSVMEIIYHFKPLCKQSSNNQL